MKKMVQCPKCGAKNALGLDANFNGNGIGVVFDSCRNCKHTFTFAEYDKLLNEYKNERIESSI